ncbi:family 43 glycosylhydrolase, partial [Dactylosporangium siamense]
MNLVRHLLAALLATGALVGVAQSAQAAANLISNPSFDADPAPTQTPAGWSEAEGAANSYTEPNGGARTGALHLTQWGTAAYRSYTYQIRTALPAGTYVLSAWVRSSGGQRLAYMEVKNHGGATVNAPVPATNTYTRISLTVAVSSGTAWLGFYSDADAYQWIYVDDVEFARQDGTGMSYANPILLPKPPPATGTEEVRDPAIIRDGNAYYMVYTNFPFTDRAAADPAKPDLNSSPGISLYRSTDLRTWTFVRWLIRSADLPVNSPYKHRFWAPEIRKVGAKYYLSFTADNWISASYNIGGQWGYHMFLGVADSVEGPYTHISDSGEGCDASLFDDPATGRTYIVAPYHDLFVQEVDLTRLATEDRVVKVGPRVKVVDAANADIGYPTDPQYLEGPWMTKRDGRWYLFHAA